MGYIRKQTEQCFGSKLVSSVPLGSNLLPFLLWVSAPAFLHDGLKPGIYVIQLFPPPLVFGHGFLTARERPSRTACNPSSRRLETHSFWVSLLSWFRQTKGLQDSVRAFVSKSNVGIARDCYLKFNSGLHKERCSYVHLPTYLHMYTYRTYKELTARCGAYLRQSQDSGGRV